MTQKYDSLGVAVKELNAAIRWRDIARLARASSSPIPVKAARRMMRTHALRSRKAFAGEVLFAL